MVNLLYKEIKLSIPVFFWILPFLFAALLMIPQWIFFIAFFYFFWITVPQVLSSINTNNDIQFSILMPISKKDYVKSKIMIFSILGLLHIILGAIVAIIHGFVYDTPNFLFDLNFAFFGFVFIIFGVFNLILFPMYFKTGYKFGLPVIVATIVTILIAGGLETLNLINSSCHNLFEGVSSTMRIWQLLILIVGIIIFIFANYLAYIISTKKFECVDL